MKQLLIIGAGNVGGFVVYNSKEFGDYEILGFLDDDPEKLGKYFYGMKVLGCVNDIDKYQHHKELGIVIGISSPQAKSTIVKKLSPLTLFYPNLISRNVWLSNHTILGQGVILYPGVSVNYETKIEDFAILNMNCAIGHNCTIGRYSTLAPGVNLAGFTFLEEEVSMGIGSATKQNIRVGQSAVIGGQTMLIKDVAAKSRVSGVPGRVMND